LTYPKKEKSDEAVSGEYGGFGALFIRSFSKNSTESLAVCYRELSACIINLRSLFEGSDAHHSENVERISVTERMAWKLTTFVENVE
jgi:hypothetical protein